jgi:transcriptional regulator with XRE-family HTH domain
VRQDYNTGRKNVVGPRIRLARAKAKPALTQADLSARLETIGVRIDRAGISKIENQERIVTDFELIALADALRVTVAWLLGGRADPDEADDILISLRKRST